ncbi:MAG: TIGR02449 family protein [Wenzhouxiangellaceae bacterium]|nr:TIGR02449 family protein [Wenzhouxiangellaceae bacterium]
MSNQQTRHALDRIEQRIDQLLEQVDRLERENRSLMERQQTLVHERAGLVQRNEEARTRVEAMIERLKSLENAG